MNLIRHITSFILPALLPVAIAAQEPASNNQPEDPEADDVELSDVEGDERATLTGVVEILGAADDIDIPVPPFIKQQANHIIFNGADWSATRADFEASARKPVSIVQIGDSHVQADISSGTARELLQYDFGNAGRGLVTPLKISGTNQPSDYIFQSRNSWIPNKLMSQSWRQTVGFTGLSIRPSSQTSELTIGTVDKEDYNPFTSLTIFHSGRLTVKSVTADGGQSLQFRAIPSRDYTQILLPSPQTSVTVNFSSAGDLTVFGASLSGDRPGVFYHAIGNNGAAYETYNRIGNVGEGIAPLNPSLVIISLGTNEAFGKLNTAAFTRSIDNLVKNIKAANPNARILLTTPMECQKSVYTSKRVKVTGKARKGRKAKTRYVTRKTRSYALNRNIAPLRQAILDYGKNNGIAVYDWYEVAGGQGASAKWIDKGLFANDRVHHTRAGYTLEGRMLYEALLNGLRNAR